VSSESWTEERDRLVKLLDSVRSGSTTHVNEDRSHQLHPTTAVDITALEERLAELNDRLRVNDAN
jgi:hypothetical protein